MKRAGIRRLRRNLAVSLGNSSDAAAADALERCDEESAQDDTVREHRAWALEKLGG